MAQPPKQAWEERAHKQTSDVAPKPVTLQAAAPLLAGPQLAIQRVSSRSLFLIFEVARERVEVSFEHAVVHVLRIQKENDIDKPQPSTDVPT